MAPPRHGKTELVSRRFPAWYIGRHPDKDFISASYGAELSTDFGRDVRNIVASPEYRRLFPGVRLAEDSQAKDRWHISGGGGYVAAGIGTSMTGRGAHVLNIDDPVKDRASAASELQRKTTWDWYRSVAYTRLQPGAAIVLTLTRWHEEDLAGQLLIQEAEGGERWEKLVLPAVNPDGTALWEDAYPRAVLDQTRKTIGEYEWAALYDQRPRPEGGAFFQESSLLVPDSTHEPIPGESRRLIPASWPLYIDCVFAVIDTAVKAGKEHDGLAVTYFGLSQHGQTPYKLYVLDWDYTQLKADLLITWLPQVFENLLALGKECYARAGSVGAWIEDKAAGAVLLQQAERAGWKMETGQRITPLGKAGYIARSIASKLTSMGKVERAINASGAVFRGEVKFTERAFNKVVTFKGITKNHQWDQVLGFSTGVKENPNDDLLDTFTYGVALGLGNAEGF